ncbi:hypothetical protein PIN31009_00273 [Pandoraea iniqua]|uniref:SpaN/EivJ family type III secretion system needle length determinant n=1 Tax=Pandoraea iniqua TaxID=2508288 RepID=UPI00124070C4|nr:hypothetical protein [Pandoraea iniqua]VVD64374.1 hypothetical protein PIN31009_00273 [Pandoraea iniqua]
METVVMRTARPSPAGTDAGADDSDVTQAFEQALRRRAFERKPHDVSDGSAPSGVPPWPMLWHADTAPSSTLQRLGGCAVVVADRAAREPQTQSFPRHEHARATPGDTGGSAGTTVHMPRVAPSDLNVTGSAERIDATPSSTSAISSASSLAVPPSASTAAKDHRRRESGATDTMPVPGLLGLPGNAARDTAHAMPLPSQAPRDRHAPPPPGGSDRYVPSVGSDGLRYAFDSWGKGHFVHVQRVQIDGRQGFVLGASDALVQRRLQAMWPGTVTSGSRWQLDASAASKVAGIDQMGDAMQEEGEC